MSQEIDQLAARVAGVVKDEIAAAELRGRTAGEAAGREEVRAQMSEQVKALEERVAELESARPAGIVDEEGGPFLDSSPEARAERTRLREERLAAELREENRLLREQLEACRKDLRDVPPPADKEKAFSGKRGRK